MSFVVRLCAALESTLEVCVREGVARALETYSKWAGQTAHFMLLAARGHPA